MDRFLLLVIYISFLQLGPVQYLPEGGEVGGAAVLPVKVVGVFPYVKGEDGLEAAGDGVAGAGLLGDLQEAVRGGGKPHPAAAEKPCAFGFEICLEGVQGTPLRFNLRNQMPGQAGHDGRVRAGHDGRVRAGHDVLVILGGAGGSELGEVKVVVQYLAGIVENGAGGGVADNLLQGQVLEGAAGEEFVQVVNVGLEVLSVVEGKGPGADYGFQRIWRVWKFYQ